MSTESLKGILSVMNFNGPKGFSNFRVFLLLGLCISKLNTATVVATKEIQGEEVFFPDTLVGNRSVTQTFD